MSANLHVCNVLSAHGAEHLVNALLMMLMSMIQILSVTTCKLCMYESRSLICWFLTFFNL